jgi:hypothetical protein
MKVMSTVATHCAMGKDPLPLFEIACLFVCLDHVASSIVNANHSIISNGSYPIASATNMRRGVNREKSNHPLVMSPLI